MPELTVAFTGFITSLTLIFAIGAQNMFVLRQGIKGDYVFWIALLCAGSDALLITLGVLFTDTLTTFIPPLKQWLFLAGVLFILGYGLLRLWHAWHFKPETHENLERTGFWPVTLTALAFTYLNPHVYVDTFVLLGGLATRYEGYEKILFTGGAILASFTFFFTLAAFARVLSPFFQSAKAWRVLDFAIGCFMLVLAGVLFYSL